MMPKLLQIKVKDTGIGIPEAEQAFIFDRFYQAGNKDQLSGGGTGIGLAHVHALVSLMQGSIQVESKLKQGTTICVDLPITNKAPLVSAATTPLIKSNQQKSESKTTLSPKASSDKPLLLIIEDNADVMEYLVTALEDEYQLKCAVDGQEGVDMAIAEVPDLIISDVMMPRKNGFEVCAFLKTDQRTSHIPIVLLTARSDDDSRIEGLSQGADAYLAKPFIKEGTFGSSPEAP